MAIRNSTLLDLKAHTASQWLNAQSSLRLLIIVTSTLFATDALVMFLHALFPPLPLAILSLLDSILVIALLFPILYFFVFQQSRLRVTQLLKTNEELKTQITERKRAEESLRQSEKQLRSLSSELLTAQEAERRRISEELHDELGQALTAIKLQVSSIGKKLKKDEEAIRKECGDTLKYIDQTIENVRRLSRELSPFILKDLGLPLALRWLANEFGKHYHVEVSMDIKETDDLLPQESQLAVYRIFQETLTNIGKHAQATQMSIATKQENGSFSFMVEDNGKGFDMGRLLMKNSVKGMGLTTMKERVRILGGSLNMWSQEGKGTQITFQIPVKRGET